MLKSIFIIFLVLISALLFGCSKKAEKRRPPAEPPKLVIGKDFYYLEDTRPQFPNSNPAEDLGFVTDNIQNFKKLADYSEHNLMHVFGKDQHYVWLKADFEIPPAFKNQPLGLVIPHLRFAEQVYCNGTFISQYGAFPPNEQSTLFKAHFFSFPLSVLHQTGKNTVLIKVFIQGDSGISSHAYIHPARYSYSAFEKLNFKTSRIYMLFFGTMLFTFILYLCFYIKLPNYKEYRDFAFLNLFTALFIVYFFATELPVYTSGQLSHLTLAKFIFCIPGYLVVYFTTKFSANYYRAATPLFLKILRLSIIALQVILTLFAPDYKFLVLISPPMMMLLIIQILSGIAELSFQLTKKENRRSACLVLLGFTPLTIGIIIDILLRLYDNTKSYPYNMIFGWQGSIIIFIIMLAIRFTQIYKSNENLKNHLQEEVDARTHELQGANQELSILNERLERDKHRSDMDLEMASLVQRNFFPQPNKHFKGWEIAICYAPQAKVSGDLYDYYSYNDILNGLSLFDVSGHGLSASLVTMLSKNIIARVFQTGFRRGESIDKILTKINNMIISEKGEIDNYMTGILCRFDNLQDTDQCKVQLGNAGHPYPLKFSAQDNEVFELKENDGKQHYGAIGMQGIKVSFASSDFVMSLGDILVCYTDGITEATNSKYEQFGVERIKKVIKENSKKSSNELLKLIMDSLDQFTQDKPLEDDVTVIIAKRTNVSDFISDEHEEEYEEKLEELEEAE